jgi:translocator protein
MQLSGYGLRRIHLLRTRVNRGKRALPSPEGHSYDSAMRDVECGGIARAAGAGDWEVRCMASENSIFKLVGSVLLCEAAGGIGSVYTFDGVRDWYPKLQKPSFTPPGWVFAPVWTLLYAMMGLSLYLASQRRKEEDDGVWRASRVLFGTQLALNVLWSYVFFRRRSPGWALVEILFLWVAIAATIFAFSRISRIAGLLLLPYLLWTSFAAVLNHSIWHLNR